MNKEFSPTKIAKIAKYSKALGHPIRLQICQFLAKNEECYFGAIDEVTPLAKATVSQHLKALKEAGLIKAIEETPKVKYSLNKKNWNDAKQLFEEFLTLEKKCCKGK